MRVDNWKESATISCHQCRVEMIGHLHTPAILPQRVKTLWFPDRSENSGMHTHPLPGMKQVG